MYTIHTQVIYGASGVCEISDIRRETFAQEEKEYYVLHPVGGSGSTIFVPVDNPVLTGRMKKLLNAREIQDLLAQPVKSYPWVKDNRGRSEKYRQTLEKGDREELLALIRSVWTEKQTRLAQGKKLWALDENALARAEKILYDEFSLVLDEDQETIIARLRGE